MINNTLYLYYKKMYIQNCVTLKLEKRNFSNFKLRIININVYIKIQFKLYICIIYFIGI